MPANDSYHGLAATHSGKTFDKLCEFTATGTKLTAAGNSNVLDLGTGFVDADLVFDVSESTGDNSAKIQFSADKDFTAPVDGPSATLKEGTTILPFRNAIGNDQPLPFVRVAYTVGTSLTLTAFAAKK